jgi:hypothetical protein
LDSEQAAQDAANLLSVIVERQPGAAEGQWFEPGPADADRAGLDYHPNGVRFDKAMLFLLNEELIEEVDLLPTAAVGVPDYDYGSAFRITERGRRMLRRFGIGEQG